MKLALVVALALALALAACGSRPQAAAPIANTGTGTGTALTVEESGFSDGALWTCTIDDYPAQPCKLSKTLDGWHLAKLLGSQRFKGSLEATSSQSLRFVGEYFCPWGDCTMPMNGTFEADGDSYVGSFGDGAISLRYDAALAAEWGGAGYGGLTGDEQ